MPRDFTRLLWGLKLGAGLNLVLLAGTLRLEAPDSHAVVPAQILLAVSAFRCLFPNRYVDNVVFHDTAASSIFLTRLLATFSEVAYIYQFSHVLRVSNAEALGWVTALSWLMVLQVVVSQGFVWSAIGTKRLGLYFWEELGWLVIFAANTLASGALLAAAAAPGDAAILLWLNLVFGVFYLPWQVLHLRSLRREAAEGRSGGPAQPVPWAKGLRDALHQRSRRSDAASWGGTIGLTWMVAYWASLIPLWSYGIAVVLSSR
jgi:hypothetical protein